MEQKVSPKKFGNLKHNLLPSHGDPFTHMQLLHHVWSIIANLSLWGFVKIQPRYVKSSSLWQNFSNWIIFIVKFYNVQLHIQYNLKLSIFFAKSLFWAPLLSYIRECDFRYHSRWKNNLSQPLTYPMTVVKINRVIAIPYRNIVGIYFLYASFDMSYFYACFVHT